MRGQDLVRFLNAGQELPSWDCHTGSACLDIESATEVLSMFTVQHVNWQPGQQTLVARLHCKKPISCKQSENCYNKFS